LGRYVGCESAAQLPQARSSPAALACTCLRLQAHCSLCHATLPACSCAGTQRDRRAVWCVPAGNCGISVDLPAPAHTSAEMATFAALFAEELGLVLEVDSHNAATVSSLFNQAGVPCSIIGKVRRTCCCINQKGCPANCDSWGIGQQVAFMAKYTAVAEPSSAAAAAIATARVAVLGCHMWF